MRSTPCLPALLALVLLPRAAVAGPFPEGLPIAWSLPEGWNAFLVPSATGGTTVALSGEDAAIYARAWVWRTGGGSLTPIDARRRMDAELGPGWTLARTVSRQDFHEVTFLGSSTGDLDPRKVDRVVEGRVGRVGNDLVAVGVFVEYAGKKAAQARALELLARARFGRPERAVDQFGNVIAAWPVGSGVGQIAQ